VNEAALGAAGGKREEVIGRKFWEPWWTPLPEEVARLKDKHCQKCEGRGCSGRVLFLFAGWKPPVCPSNPYTRPRRWRHVTMIVATGLDLTEQKELRDDLEVRVKAAHPGT